MEFAIDASGLFDDEARPIATLPVRGAADYSPDGDTAGDDRPLLQRRRPRRRCVAPAGCSPAWRRPRRRRRVTSRDHGDRAIRAPPAGRRPRHPMTSPDSVPLMRRARPQSSQIGRDDLATRRSCPASSASRVSSARAPPPQTLRDGELVTVNGNTERCYAGEIAVADGDRVRDGPARTVGGGVTRYGDPALVNLAEPCRATRVAAPPVDGVRPAPSRADGDRGAAGRHPRVLIEQGKMPPSFVAPDGRGADHSSRARSRRGRSSTATIDFRTNEFTRTRGRGPHEPVESNPMIGYRGSLRATRASPTCSHSNWPRSSGVWDAGHTNLHLMLPFVRTPWEMTAWRNQSASRLAG